MPGSAELRRRTIRGLAWSALESWGSQAISVGVFIVLARYLEAEAFGLLGMAAVFIALVETLVDQGMSDALVQRETLEDGHRDTAFWTAVGTGSVLTLAGLALAGQVAALFDEPRLAPVVAWLSVTVLVRSLATAQSALLRRDLDFRPLALRTLAGTVVGGFVGVTMAVAGRGVWALVGQQIASAVVASALLWFSSDWRPSFSFEPARFGEMFPFGSRIVGGNLVNFLNRHTDDLFIGAYLGAASLGVYTVAYRLLRTATSLLTGFSSSVAFPAFSRLQATPDRMRRSLYAATYLTALVSVPAFVGAAVLAPELIEVVFGTRWLAAAPVMRVLAFIGILHSVFYFTNNALNALGHAGWVFRLNVLNAVTNVAAFWIAVRWGIVVVAAAYVVRGYLVAPVRLTLLRRLVGLDLGRYLGQLAIPSIASAVMAVAIVGGLRLLVPHATAGIRLALGVPVGMIIYASVVWTLDADGLRKEARLLRSSAAPSPAADS